MEIILIAINEWDPIGFFPMAPKDEYMNEIKKIYEYLNAIPNVTEEKLAKKINEIGNELQNSKIIKEYKKIKEVNGHTPMEVICGCLLGFFIWLAFSLLK